MFLCCGYGYRCHHQQNLVSVYAMDANLEMLAGGAPRDVCVFVHARSRVGMCMRACVCRFPSPVDSYLCVCLCMYMYVNTTEQL